MVHIEEQYQLPRDFEGYGPSPPSAEWPNNARIAISFVLNYEEGGERGVLEGDAHSEPYLWEKGSSSGYKEGARYLNAEQDFEYGSRVGVWRLMRLFEEFGWQITIYAVARAMQLNPAFGVWCREKGHEIANHGLRWLDFWGLGVEEDKKYGCNNSYSPLHPFRDDDFAYDVADTSKTPKTSSTKSPASSP